ncbi:hypothetical protein AB0F68_12260 [Micromonospora sp. NPDC023966]|uniref:hypothetical protein n=1 Tax=Micromonospora sp. NPDC023966 TaxID=3154699 RepID=UPI0034100DB0
MAAWRRAHRPTGSAQAFLLTIALGPDSTRPARTVAALLGAALAGLCAQLMAQALATGDK